MKIGDIKRELNVWQFQLLISRRSPWQVGFHPYLRISLLKVLKFPNEGSPAAHGEHYRGIHWDFVLPLPRVYAYHIYPSLYALVGIKPYKLYPSWVVRFFTVPFIHRIMRLRIVLPIKFTFA